MSGEATADFYDFVVTDIGYVLDRRPNPEWAVHRFINPWYHIVVIALSGQAHYEIAGTPYTIVAGDVVFMPKGVPHTGVSDAADPWHFLTVGFDATSGGDVMRQMSTLPNVTRDRSLQDLAAMFTEIGVAWTDQRPGYLIRIRGLVTMILYRLIRSHSLPQLHLPHTRRINRVVDLIRADYQSTYSVEDLAAIAGLSPSHFRTMFKRVTGQTVTEFQQNVKITKATELLLSGECNVTQAALRSGFRDVYYFSRLFKKVTGTNPSSLIPG